MEYTIRASRKHPITAQYKGKLDRMVIYKTVRVARTLMGCDLGIQYGFIRHECVTRIVCRNMQSNGQYSQWELIH